MLSASCSPLYCNCFHGNNLPWPRSSFVSQLLTTLACPYSIAQGSTRWDFKRAKRMERMAGNIALVGRREVVRCSYLRVLLNKWSSVGSSDEPSWEQAVQRSGEQVCTETWGTLSEHSRTALFPYCCKAVSGLKTFTHRANILTKNWFTTFASFLAAKTCEPPCLLLYWTYCAQEDIVKARSGHKILSQVISRGHNHILQPFSWSYTHMDHLKPALQAAANKQPVLLLNVKSVSDQELLLALKQIHIR